MRIDFKGKHFPQSAILFAVVFYVCYGVSYRDLEEIMTERGVAFDHATLNRWVVNSHRWSLLMRGPERSRQLHLGGWMRPTSRYVESGPTCTALLIGMGEILTLCFQNAAIPLLREGSSSEQLAQMVSLIVLPSTKVVPTWLAYKV